MVCTAEPSGVRRPPWEVLPSRRPIVQRPRADCEDDPEPGTRTSTRHTYVHLQREGPCTRALHNELRLDDPSCSGPVPTAKTTLNPAHVRPERRALQNEPRLDDPAHVRPERRALQNEPRLDDPSCSGPVPTAKTTLNPAHVRPERRALQNEPRLDDTIRLVEHGPETLRGLKLGCVARQMEQPDPVWNAKIRFGVPASLVQHEHDAALAAGRAFLGEGRKERGEERLGDAGGEIPDRLAREGLGEGRDVEMG